jgi:acyl carrier protein
MSSYLDRVRPRTATEERLAKIWEELLETSDVGVNEHFFDVGGESLSGTRCIFKVREVFGVQLSLEEFFAETATIARFAQIIDDALSNPQSLRIPK